MSKYTIRNYTITDILNILKLGGIIERNQHLLVAEPTFCKSFHTALRQKLIEPQPNKTPYYMNYQVTDKGERTRTEANEAI